MKKAGILLSILLFSMSAVMLPVTFPAVKAQTSDLQETNSGVGRPYQDLNRTDVSFNETHLRVNITLREGPPKIDNETHVNIYVAIDTMTGGTRYFPDFCAAEYDNSDYNWEYCFGLYSWNNKTYAKPPDTASNMWRGIHRIDSSFSHVDALTLGVDITNSSDGRIVNMTIPKSAIGDPSNVTIGIITHEDGTGTGQSGSPRDTMGNGTVHCVPDAYQWIEVQPFTIDLPTGAGNSDFAVDATNDFVVKEYHDITEVEVGYEGAYVVVNVTFVNVTGLTPFKFDEEWDLVIAIDTDHVINDINQSWLAYTEYDVRIDPNANETYWERCIVVDDNETDIHLFDENLNDLGDLGIRANLIAAENKIKVRIPMAVIPFDEERKLRLTVMSGADPHTVYDVVGTCTYSYEYDAAHAGGSFLITTPIPLSSPIPLPPSPPAPELPKVVGRPYQDLNGTVVHSNGTHLSLNITLAGAPPKIDNETHVNIYVAFDNGTASGNYWFPDNIDAAYVNDAYFWEYCLALYNWTGAVQHVDLINATWGQKDALALGVTVTNSSANFADALSSRYTVNITIPLSVIGVSSPSPVTIGIVTSEDYGKVRDTVGNGTVRLSLYQWIEIQPAFVGLSTSADSGGSASDPVGDFVGKAYWDIRDVSVAPKGNNIVVNVTFLNVSCLAYSFGQWLLAIGIDLDHVSGSGQHNMAFLGYSDTRIDSAINTAYWERCVVVDDMGSAIHIYDEKWYDMKSMGAWASLIEEENKVMVSIPQCILPVSHEDRSLNLTVICGMDQMAGQQPRVYDIYGDHTYTYTFVGKENNTQGYFNITLTLPPTGPVVYQFPPTGIPINDAMGRPFQDLTNVTVHSDGTTLSINVTLREGPPKQDNETHVNIYVAFDTEDGGRSWFPNDISARYNLSTPEHFWDYCLGVYSWTNLTGSQQVVRFDRGYDSINALNNSLGNVTITNSTDGSEVRMWVPLALIDNPSTVTIGVVTSEDYSKVKDTIGNGTARLVCGQWIEVQPAIIDLPTGACNGTFKADNEKDFVMKAFWDITDVNVNVNYTDIIVDVIFRNVTGLSDAWGDWWLSIQIDIDHLNDSGEPFIYAPGTGTDTRFANHSMSEWELCAIINSPTAVTLWNITGTPPNETSKWLGSGGVEAAFIEAQSKVRVAIPVDWLKNYAWDYNFTVTVVSGADAGNRVYDIFGAYEYEYAPGASGYEYHGCYIAHTDPSLNYTGPYYANFSLANITMVNLNMDYWFDADPTLVVAFYDYNGTYQVNQTVWTITSPKRVTNTTDVKHPDGKPIEIVKLLLVEDSGKVSVIQEWVVSRSDLMKRATDIDSAWPAASVAQRQAYMKELALIDLQWHYAPPTWP